jgi:hypothetical protein
MTHPAAPRKIKMSLWALWDFEMVTSEVSPSSVRAERDDAIDGGEKSSLAYTDSTIIRLVDYR